MVAYLILFFNAFLAATVLPLSSEPLFIALLANKYKAVWLIIAASAGNSLGGFTAYWLGFLAKWKWLKKYFKINLQQIEAKQRKIKKYGSVLAFFCWLPLIGDILAVALGFFKINWIQVFIFLTIGKVFRYTIIWATYSAI